MLSLNILLLFLISIISAWFVVLAALREKLFLQQTPSWRLRKKKRCAFLRPLSDFDGIVTLEKKLVCSVPLFVVSVDQNHVYVALYNHFPKWFLNGFFRSENNLARYIRAECITILPFFGSTFIFGRNRRKGDIGTQSRCSTLWNVSKCFGYALFPNVFREYLLFVCWALWAPSFIFCLSSHQRTASKKRSGVRMVRSFPLFPVRQELPLIFGNQDPLLLARSLSFDFWNELSFPKNRNSAFFTFC